MVWQSRTSSTLTHWQLQLRCETALPAIFFNGSLWKQGSAVLVGKLLNTANLSSRDPTTH
jgi:hypothetical protein